MQTFSCLMYHNVCQDGSLADPNGEWAHLSPSIKSYFVEESAFAAQLAALHGSTDLITLDRVRNYFGRQAPRFTGDLPDIRESVLLTFDDGWAGTVDLAMPVLERYSAEATVFITTELLDQPGFLRAAELHRWPTQLQVGSHCRTHRFLNELDDAEIREELRSSKLALEDLCGRPIDTVSIPNGAIDTRVERIAVELGYALVFTSEVHLNSHWSGATAIGRAAIRSQTSRERVLEYAHGDFGMEPVRRLALGIPKRLLGPKRYRHLRAWWFGEQTGQLEMQDLLAPEKEATSASEHSSVGRV